MTGSSRTTSPFNPLKRGPGFERDDLPSSKRPRSGESLDALMRPPNAPAYVRDHRASIDFPPRSVYTPTPIDSASTSAHPRQGSPNFGSRGSRGLPSPSSLAYGPPAGLLAPPGIKSTTSPTSSHPPSTSVHSAPANSATSAHIADLQHQVTLKSLALQSLQSEYASLLQKLQRERVKSQTIEKKTTVADNEVNELTGRNEELTDQVKVLEARVEELEKRREVERADAARDKEQWGRMLEMGGRLQARTAEDRQKIVEERDGLLKRVATCEEEHNGRIARPKEDYSPRVTATESSDRSFLSHPTSTATGRSRAQKTDDTAALKEEVEWLKDQATFLRSTLQRIREHNLRLITSWDAVSEESTRIGEEVEMCVDSEAASNLGGQNHLYRRRGRESNDTGLPSKHHAPARVLKGISQIQRSSSASRKHVSTEQPTSADPAAAVLRNAAAVGRALSPGPEELGFHVEPTSSSPEELIRALGPLPTAGPQTQTTHDPPTQRKSSDEGFSEERGPANEPASAHLSPHPIVGGGTAPKPGSQEQPNEGLQVPSWTSQHSHLPSPRPSIVKQDEPPSFSRSSPIPAQEDASRSATFSSPPRDRSPKSNTSEPFNEPKNLDMAHSDMKGYYTAQAPRSFPSMGEGAMHIPAFRQWGPHAQDTAMPPPPRPT